MRRRHVRDVTGRARVCVLGVLFLVSILQAVIAERVHRRAGKATAPPPYALLLENDEGMFLVDDAVIPDRGGRVAAGFVAYWLDRSDEFVYVYDALIFERSEIVPALLALQRDRRIDVRKLAQPVAWLSRPLAQAHASAAPADAFWRPASEGAIRRAMRWRVQAAAIQLEPIHLNAEVIAAVCGPPLASIQPALGGPAESAQEKAARLIGEAVRILAACGGGGGGTPPCSGSCCDDPCCGDPCCGDPCCDDPCCGDPCCNDRCCQGSDCCQSPDPCCDSNDPCCGNPDRCCNADNPCCESSDPCCDSNDPCCGSLDPCCNDDNPCCGNGDPCCDNNDPCCNVGCEDGDPCTDNWCSNGSCVSEPVCGGLCCEGDCCTTGASCCGGTCCPGEQCCPPMCCADGWVCCEGICTHPVQCCHGVRVTRLWETCCNGVPCAIVRCCGNGECCNQDCEGCWDNGTLSGGTVTVSPTVVCLNDTITFTVSGVVDSGGVKRVDCSAKESIPPLAPTYTWIITKADGSTLSGSGASASITANAFGTYSCFFTASVARECAPGPHQISSNKNVPPHTCMAALADGNGCPGKTIPVARTVQNTSTTCQATFNWEVKKTQGTANVTPNPATGTITVSCPSQTVSGAGAVCGAVYGGFIHCYGCADGQAATNWWFKESVTSGAGNCASGGIDQTSNPIQSSSGCVTDEITNLNGPPGNVAPCSDTTNQTVYAGPTQARVTLCTYQNTQVITVTSNPNPPPNGTVTTSSAGASVSCNY